MDHRPLPETPDAFQKEQFGPKWLSSCGRDEKKKRKETQHERFFSIQVWVWSPVRCSEANTDLQVSEGEDHRLGQVDPARAAVYGGRDDMRVDHQALSPGFRALGQTQAEPQRGVLSGQEGAQVLVEGED